VAVEKAADFMGHIDLVPRSLGMDGSEAESVLADVFLGAVLALAHRLGDAEFLFHVQFSLERARARRTRTLERPS
jgi:hypothetical protein